MTNNYLTNKANTLLYTFLIVFSLNICAQDATVQINTSIQKYLGEVSELDRSKYFNIHASNPNDADVAIFLQDYNAGLGRAFWGPFSFAKNKTGEVGVYPAYKDGNSNVRNITKNMIATEHPYNVFKDGIDTKVGADWAAEYYKDFVSDGDAPEFFELMNEPFVHASEYYEGGWNIDENYRIVQQMSEFYNEVGLAIHNEPALANMKVIGYSSAWPSMELNDFDHWDNYMKRFMDVAGANMDGFSTHLYDGINVTGQDTYRSGSNSEAILDLIENYSYIKWGFVKPHAISEFGGIEKGYGDDFSLIANIQSIKAINHLMIGLLDREDRLSISIPFIGDKALWHINEANNYQPYGAVLFIPSNIGEPNPTGWHYTERIHFFEQWKNVKGNRIFIKSDNPDIQTQAFADGNKLYVILSNLDFDTKNVDLSFIQGTTNVESVLIKSLKIYDQTMPSFTSTTVTEAPASITLIKDETVTLEYTFSENIAPDNAIRYKNYYTLNYLEEIKANTAINYGFSNVTTGEGYATLRMSIGRKHDVTKSPLVKINGQTIDVPSNWQGYDQANRDDFFGTIEIPFDASLLNESNSVTIEFPDNGGRIASLVLNVGLLDKSENTLSIKTVGETCQSSNNGKIILNPFENNAYTATLSGNGVNENLNFSYTSEFNNLEAGTYTIIITSPSDPDFKEKYNVVITEPEALSVQSKFDKTTKKVSLSLKGSSEYRVTVNGLTFITTKSSISIPVENGVNQIEVTTENDCQGKFSESYNVGESIIAYPNPFKNNFTIDLGLDNSTEAGIEIFSPLGKLIYKQQKDVKNGKIQLNTEFLKPGYYLVSIKTSESFQNLKIIKN